MSRHKDFLEDVAGCPIRNVLTLIQPRTQYQLTAYGNTLLEAMNPLVKWAIAHLGKKNCRGGDSDTI